MNLRLRLAVACAFCVCLAVWSAGCSRGVVAKGQPKLAGQNLTITDKDRIILNFFPEGESETGKSYGANVNKDGTFDVKGVDGGGMPPGKYKVVAEFQAPYPGTDKFGGKYSAKNSKLIVDIGSAPVEIDFTN